MNFKIPIMPWPIWLSWLEHHPACQRVTGSIPSWGACERQPINLSFSLSPPPLPLSKISFFKKTTHNFMAQNTMNISVYPLPVIGLRLCVGVSLSQALVNTYYIHISSILGFETQGCLGHSISQKESRKS